MTDRTTIDSSGLARSQLPDTDATSRAAAPAPAKKPRRPRPTFEDGALTRTFKFPSKTYPRSSYYVTSTEIIIRIKKARKKWKMTIPKKRVVSYRTNRWFAKPRWIAIELTYTQAVKLGLAEARPRISDAPPVVNTGIPAQLAAGDHEHLEGASLDASNVGSDASQFVALDGVRNDQGAQDAHVRPEPYAQVPSAEAHDNHPPDSQADGVDLDDPNELEDLVAEQEGAEHFELALDTDEPDAEAERETEPEIEPEAPDERDAVVIPLAAGAAARVEEASPSVEAQKAAPSAQVVPFMTPTQPSASAPRRSLRPTIATLAAAVAGYALWAAFDTTALPPAPVCVQGQMAAGCGAPIVTGAIGPAGAPTGSTSTADEEPPLSHSQIAAVARTELAEQSREEAEAAIAVSDEKAEVAATEAAARDTVAIVLPGRDFSLPLSPPLITASVEIAKPIATVQPVCDKLDVAARELQITFDYARSRLDPGALPGLDEFAAKLRGCPETKILVEGHTDSDGRAANNRSLSLRRAEAVQKHLVAAGVEPQRVDAVGFGQTRPAAPNVSPKNKRSNRRVVIVVTTPR